MHPMCGNNRDILDTVPENWLNNFKRINFTILVRGTYYKYRKSKIRLNIIGATYEANISKLRVRNFNCVWNTCDAETRIRNAVHIFGNVSSNDQIFEQQIEILQSHTCPPSIGQEVALKYVDLLRRYLKNGNALVSYIALNVFPLDDRPKIAVFDHFLKPVQSIGAYKFCDSDIRYKCSDTCPIKVQIRSRDIYTAQITSEFGAHSKVKSQLTFEYRDDDEIPPLHKPCPNPIYMYQKVHLFSNGLSYLLPQLDVLVMEFKWTSGYRDNNDMLDEEAYYELIERSNTIMLIEPLHTGLPM